MRYRAATPGFTLIEVLVALAITSVILAALYSAFFTAHAAIDSSGDTIERLHEARSALDILRREIEASLTYNEAAGRDSFAVRDRDLYGDPASRVTLSTSGSVLPGPARVSYYVSEHDGRRSLMKRVSGIAEDVEKGMEAGMVSEIVSFEVEARSKEGWTKTWEENSLPIEVRITLTIPMTPARNLSMSISAVPRVGRKA